MTTPFICHIEWGTPDRVTLEKFLTQLFSWQFQAFVPNDLSYGPADGDHMRVGESPNESRQVTDMESMLAKAEELGAKIVVPKTPLGDGSFAFIAAPDGSLIGFQTL